jgi:hypothetical protein
LYTIPYFLKVRGRVMTTISLKIKDDSKVDFVLNTLKDFDFIEIEKNAEVRSSDGIGKAIGIWKDRDITLETIRKETWRNKQNAGNINVLRNRDSPLFPRQSTASQSAHPCGVSGASCGIFY